MYARHTFVYLCTSKALSQFFLCANTAFQTFFFFFFYPHGIKSLPFLSNLIVYDVDTHIFTKKKKKNYMAERVQHIWRVSLAQLNSLTSEWGFCFIQRAMLYELLHIACTCSDPYGGAQQTEYLIK